MASQVTGAPVAPSQSTAPKKKARMNPARRKAARSKTESQAEEIRPVPLRTSSTPQARTNQPTTTRPQPQAAPTATRPPQLSRIQTAPLPQSSKPAPSGTLTTRTARTNAAFKTQSPTSQLALAGPALITGGLIGCAASAAILLGVGLWHDFSGAESALLAAKSAKLCVDNLSEEIIASLKTGTYSADEALDVLRRTTLAYASTIPGGAPFVERMFAEISTVRRQRGREVDGVVAETHGLLTNAGKRGAEAEEMRGIVLGQMGKLAGFASKATKDVVVRNPGLRPLRDGAIEAVRDAPGEPRPGTVRVNMAVRQMRR